MGDNYVGNDELGRQCHSKRKMFEYNLNESGLSHVKRQLYQTIAQFGIGREVVSFGIKKE